MKSSIIDILNQLEIFYPDTVQVFDTALKNDDVLSLRQLQRHIINHSDRSNNNHSPLVKNIDNLIFEVYGC